MPINLLDIFILISLAQGLIFGLVVWVSPIFKGTHNRYLAASIFMISVVGLNIWLSGWDFDEQYYLIDYFGDDTPWILLMYVPLFVYVLKRVEHPLGQKPRLFFYLSIPFLLFVILNLVVNFDVDFGLYEIPNVEDFQLLVYGIEYYVAMGYNLILSVLSWWLIVKSRVEAKEKMWLKRILAFTLAMIVCWVVVDLADEWLEHPMSTSVYGMWTCISLFFYWLTYQGLFRFKLASDQAAIQALLLEKAMPLNPIPPISDKDELSLTPIKDSPKDSNPHFERLEQLIQDTYIHRDPNLSRELVAEKLGISAGYLSQILNGESKQNFSSYINSYRVEDVKRMISDPSFDRYSLLAIGMEAGFKSKSAFYTSFKKETGMTPSQFKNQRA